MQKRIRLFQILAGVFAFLFAVSLVAVFMGRHNTTPVIVVKSDQLNVNKPLYEQREFLEIKEISTKEFEEMGGRLAQNYDQLKGQKLTAKLSKGSPIPLDLLTKSKLAGQFAYDTPMNHSLFLIPDGVATLPPGLEVYDRISIKLIFEDTVNKDERYIGELVKDAKIASIAEKDIWVYVSDNDFNKLSVSREFGTFVLTLPGVKEVGTCAEVAAEINQDKEDELAALNEDKTYLKASPEKQAETREKIAEEYELRLLTAECVDKDDEGGTIYSQDIKNMIRENGELLSDDEFSTDEEAELEETTSTEETTPSNTVSE